MRQKHKPVDYAIWYWLGPILLIVIVAYFETL